MASVAGDLRQMRDANDLVRPAQGRQLFTEHITQAAADVGVDLVEDERADLVVGGQHGLEGQHGARQFAS